MDIQYDENLSSNLFFLRLQFEHGILLDTAPIENWIVCVPRSGSVNEYCLNHDEFLLSHILIPNDELPETHFINLNCQIVKLYDRKLIVDYGGVSFESRILFEEVFYTKDFLKYKVWCIERPLDRMDQYGGHEKAEANGELYIVRNLHDAINLISLETKSKSVFNKIDSAVSNFIKNNADFNQTTLEKLKTNTQLLYNHCFDILLMNKRLREKCQHDQFLLKSLKISVQTYMMTKLFGHLKESINVCQIERVENFNKIIRNLSDIHISELNLMANYSDMISSIKNELIKIDEFVTVVDKVNCLKKALNITTTNKKSDKIQQSIITIDDLIPLLIFVIIKSGSTNWIMNFIFLRDFHFTESAISGVNINEFGQESFLKTTLEAAILYIESVLLVSNMILNCKVAFLILLCFMFSNGEDVQGDLKEQLSTLTKSVDNLSQIMKEFEKNMQILSSDVQKLVNQNAADREIIHRDTIISSKKNKRPKTSALTTAEIVFYQHFNSGLTGIKYYNDLQAVRDGKLKDNIIPILAKINAEELSSTNVIGLYKTLNDIALSIIKNREEAEIEAYFSEIQGDLKTFFKTIDQIHSEAIKEFANKVLFKLLKESLDIEKIKKAISYYEKDEKNLNTSIEILKETILKLPLSDALPEIKYLRSANHIINVYETLLMKYTKKIELLNVIDDIYDIDEPDSEPFMELRKKIPYNDDYLMEIIKDSVEPFKSLKLKAMMLRNHLEKDPNNPEILDLALDILSKDPKIPQDRDYIENTKKIIPKNLIVLAQDGKFCLMDQEKYLYAEYNDDLRVSIKRRSDLESAQWLIKRASIRTKNFFVMNYEKPFYHVVKPKEGHKLKIVFSHNIMSYDTWQLSFSSSFTYVKIGDGKQFFKIKDNYVILDDTATNWELSTDC